MTLRVQGKGPDRGPGMAANDLLISFRVRKDPYFTREGDDIHVTVPVSLKEVCPSLPRYFIATESFFLIQKYAVESQPSRLSHLLSNGYHDLLGNIRKHSGCYDYRRLTECEATSRNSTES
jgi:hypothetical protein